MLLEIYIGVTIALCLLIAVLIYYSRCSFFVKLATLPFAIITGIVSILMIIQLSGAPIPRYPKGEWEYMGHAISNNGKMVLLWAWIKEKKDHRLHTFPYDRKQVKELTKAKEKQQKGAIIKGRFDRMPAGERMLIMQESSPEDSEYPVKLNRKQVNEK